MPQVINFDVVTCDIVEVKKTIAGELRVWKLRDDVPTETMLALFELARDESARAPDDPVAAFRLAGEVFAQVLLGIFQHTYPETTLEEIRGAFTYAQRKELVDLFFSLAGIVSSAPSSAVPNSTPTQAISSTAPSSANAAASAMGPTPLPNRAARRAGRKAKTAAVPKMAATG